MIYDDNHKKSLDYNIHFPDFTTFVVYYFSNTDCSTHMKWQIATLNG